MTARTNQRGNITGSVYQQFGEKWRGHDHEGPVLMASSIQKGSDPIDQEVILLICF